MSDDDEKEIMILAAAPDWHTEESVLMDADCGHRCWITPESLAHLKNRPQIHTSCMPCTGLSTADLLAGKVPTVRAVPGQREKLNQVWGKEETDKVFERLRIEDL